MQDSAMNGEWSQGWEWEQKAWEGIEMVCSPFKALKQGQIENETFKQSFMKALRTIMEE